MRVHFLGTASGLPTENRFSQTTVLDFQDELHLLDAGDGASSLMCRKGLDHLRIRSITISHMHGDHHSGLIQLIKTMMHLNRRDSLKILVPGEGVAAYRSFLEMSYLVPEWLGFGIEWSPIMPEKREALGKEIWCTATQNEHLHHARERAKSLTVRPDSWNFESYSFIYEVGGTTIAYTGNLAHSLNELPDGAIGSDVIISELAHLEPKNCIQSLNRLRPQCAMFAHVNPHLDSSDRLEMLTRGLPGVVVKLAQDGDTFDVEELLQEVEKLG